MINKIYKNRPIDRSYWAYGWIDDYYNRSTDLNVLKYSSIRDEYIMVSWITDKFEPPTPEARYVGLVARIKETSSVVFDGMKMIIKERYV